MTGSSRARVGPGKPGKRISVAELRERGVDEDFLTNVRCIEGDVPPAHDETLDHERVIFVSRGAATHATLVEGVDAANSGSATGVRVHQRAWSVSDMQAEYGVGCKLLVAMGYQGGGQAPLTSVKRVERAALQDNEALARDTRFSLPTKKRHCSRTAHAEIDLLIDGGRVVDHENGNLQDVENDCEYQDDEYAGLSGSKVRRLRHLVVGEVCRAGVPVTLDEIAASCRVESVVRGYPDICMDVPGFLQEFVRLRVPECCLKHSAKPGWLKFSGSSSRASWEQVQQRCIVVTLRQPDPGKNESELWDAQSSSEDEAGYQNTPCAFDACDMPGFEREGPAPKVEARCHGCLRKYATEAELRDHLVETFCRPTTRNPTDLEMQFDPNHYDREALSSTSSSWRARQTVEPAPGVDPGWRCPVCHPRASFQDFIQLLDHARDAPASRVSHRRLLLLIAELLHQEPPPEPQRLPTELAARTAVADARTNGGPQHSTGVCDHPRDAWCSHGLGRMFEALSTDAPPDEYGQLADRVLGPEEDDIFG